MLLSLRARACLSGWAGAGADTQQKPGQGIGRTRCQSTEKGKEQLLELEGTTSGSTGLDLTNLASSWHQRWDMRTNKPRLGKRINTEESLAGFRLCLGSISRSTGTTKTPPRPPAPPRARAKPQQHARAQSSARGLPHLVVVGDDRGDLPAREHHILPRQLVDHPGAGVQRVVEGVVPAVAPVPALQLAGFLHGQDLLVNRLPLATQAHRELGRKGARGG